MGCGVWAISYPDFLWVPLIRVTGEGTAPAVSISLNGNPAPLRVAASQTYRASACPSYCCTALPLFGAASDFNRAHSHRPWASSPVCLQIVGHEKLACAAETATEQTETGAAPCLCPSALYRDRLQRYHPGSAGGGISAAQLAAGVLSVLSAV